MHNDDLMFLTFEAANVRLLKFTVGSTFHSNEIGEFCVDDITFGCFVTK